MRDQVVIERRFRGPAESGNGGYSCGVLATLTDDAVEVTLRLPPPLERPLTIEATEGEVRLRSGDALVAEARPIDDFELDVPEPVGLDRAAAARDASPLHRHHPFPGCFVCGPERRAGDGLGIVCGPVGTEVVAAPWVVDDSVAAGAGVSAIGERTAPGSVPPEIVWAALDCPSGLSALLVPEMGPGVLGRLAARIHADIRPGTTCVAIGWPIELDGRKFYAGSALFSAEGELLADARATWIELRS